MELIGSTSYEMYYTLEGITFPKRPQAWLYNLLTAQVSILAQTHLDSS